MKKVYYTSLAIISTVLEFAIDFDDQQYQVAVCTVASRMIDGDGKDTIHFHLYNRVKEILGNDQFMLVPSDNEVGLRALQEDMMYHPEKYPNNGESIGAFRFGEDS